MPRPNIYGVTKLINIRAEEELLKKFDLIRKYYSDKLGVRLSNSDILRLCLNKVYDSITEIKPL